MPLPVAANDIGVIITIECNSTIKISIKILFPSEEWRKMQHVRPIDQSPDGELGISFCYCTMMVYNVEL